MILQMSGQVVAVYLGGDIISSSLFFFLATDNISLTTPSIRHE